MSKIEIAQEAPKASLAPISHIKGVLDKVFKGEDWKNWELETISDSLNLGFDPLTLDKISVLQVMAKDPSLFLNNVDFFLHATEVMNNKVTDFDYIPMPSSLELAYAIVEAQKILGFKFHQIEAKDDITDAVSYLLREEGFSKPLWPFEFVPANRLEEGQTSSDTGAKETAIKAYIQHMESL